jgi:transcriptional regulator with XRE-family HTH domain
LTKSINNIDVDSVNPDNIVKIITDMIANGSIRNQAEICVKAGVAKGTLSNIMNGNRRAGYEFINRFSKAYLTTFSTKLSPVNEPPAGYSNLKAEVSVVEMDTLKAVIDSKNETIALLKSQVEHLKYLLDQRTGELQANAPPSPKSKAG